MSSISVVYIGGGEGKNVQANSSAFPSFDVVWRRWLVDVLLHHPDCPFISFFNKFLPGFLSGPFYVAPVSLPHFLPLSSVCFLVSSPSSVSELASGFSKSGQALVPPPLEWGHPCFRGVCFAVAFW